MEKINILKYFLVRRFSYRALSVVFIIIRYSWDIICSQQDAVQVEFLMDIYHSLRAVEHNVNLILYYYRDTKFGKFS